MTEVCLSINNIIDFIIKDFKFCHSIFPKVIKSNSVGYKGGFIPTTKNLKAEILKHCTEFITQHNCFQRTAKDAGICYINVHQRIVLIGALGCALLYVKYDPILVGVGKALCDLASVYDVPFNLVLKGMRFMSDIPFSESTRPTMRQLLRFENKNLLFSYLTMDQYQIQVDKCLDLFFYSIRSTKRNTRPFLRSKIAILSLLSTLFMGFGDTPYKWLSQSTFLYFEVIYGEPYQIIIHDLKIYQTLIYNYCIKQINLTNRWARLGLQYSKVVPMLRKFRLMLINTNQSTAKNDLHVANETVKKNEPFLCDDDDEDLNKLFITTKTATVAPGTCVCKKCVAKLSYLNSITNQLVASQKSTVHNWANLLIVSKLTHHLLNDYNLNISKANCTKYNSETMNALDSMSNKSVDHSALIEVCDRFGVFKDHSLPINLHHLQLPNNILLFPKKIQWSNFAILDTAGSWSYMHQFKSDENYYSTFPANFKVITMRASNTKYDFEYRIGKESKLYHFTGHHSYLESNKYSMYVTTFSDYESTNSNFYINLPYSKTDIVSDKIKLNYHQLMGKKQLQSYKKCPICKLKYDSFYETVPSHYDTQNDVMHYKTVSQKRLSHLEAHFFSHFKSNSSDLLDSYGECIFSKLTIKDPEYLKIRETSYVLVTYTRKETYIQLIVHTPKGPFALFVNEYSVCSDMLMIKHPGIIYEFTQPIGSKHDINQLFFKSFESLVTFFKTNIDYTPGCSDAILSEIYKNSGFVALDTNVSDVPESSKLEETIEIKKTFVTGQSMHCLGQDNTITKHVAISPIRDFTNITLHTPSIGNLTQMHK